MTFELIVQFFILTFLISGGIIFALHRVLISSVDGAKQRLERDAESARAREAELNRKIRQADDELAARKKEMDQLENRMKGEIEQETADLKEQLVTKARTDAEEIIVKAQTAAQSIRREIEKEMEIKIIDYSTKILNEIFSKKVKAAFEKDLLEEFVAQLDSVDMSKISLEIKTAEVVTSCGVSEADMKRISAVIKKQTGRDIALQPKISEDFIAGVVIKFGSLHLDGSLRHAINASAGALKADIEREFLKK